MATDGAMPIPISALEHYCYCARQCALIHVDGVWVDNEHTVRGQRGHARADQPGNRTERGRRVHRAVQLWSEVHNLTGRADAVEILADRSIVPVEYKIGVRHGDTADVQLCAEALCLEEMTGQPVSYGYLWYSATRRRLRVDFDERLRERTLEVIAAIAQLRHDHRLPMAVDDERCNHCQLLGHCLPHLTADPTAVTRYVQQEVMSCES